MSTGGVGEQKPAAEAARPAPTGPNDPPTSLPDPKVPGPADQKPGPVGDQPSPKEEPKPVTSILGDEDEKPPAAEAGAPEGGYADFKLPEGIELDKEMLDEAKTLMGKELNLSQDKAQKLVDFHVKAMQEVAEAPYQLWADTQRGWQEEVNKDPEIGGSNLPKVKTAISKLFDEYGDPGVREALSFTGAGNNPAIIKTFYKIAKALTEGQFIGGDGGAAAQRSAAQILYPTMKG